MATRRATTTGRATAERPPLAAAKVVPLDRGELGPFCDRLGLDAPSALSPLHALTTQPTSVEPRPWDELRAPLGLVADETMRHALEPLAGPDRILDTWAATYEGAPTEVRLFASRRHGPGWAGLRPALARDYEIIGPYTDDDLQLWLQLQLQVTAGVDVPLPFPTLDGAQLAFLLATVDAFATRLHASFAERRAQPRVVSFRWSDIVDAQGQSLRVRDRRFLTTAVAELFGLLTHPARGDRSVGLPIVGADLAERELRRWVDAGWLRVLERGKDPLVQLDGPMPLLATSLLGWVQLLALHDVQVTGIEQGRPAAAEEALVFVVGELAAWAIVTDGLARAGDDLTPVTFGMRTVNVANGLDVLRRFLAPAPIGELPESVYEPAGAPAAASAPAPAPAPVVTAPAGPPPAPPWAATHRVPATGLDAWPGPAAAGQPAARLDPWLDVQVVERRPDGWTHIVCSNGWAAWVDGRDLVEVTA